MPLLREKFDIRPINFGIKCHGSKHVISNQLGLHVYHIGEIVDLHCHSNTIHVKIIGEANKHLIGTIKGFSPKNDNKFENMKVGQKITFDEDNIFDCYEN
jgi:hypothetical protein